MSVQYDSTDYLDKVDAWWRAASCISVAQVHLKDNLLLMRPIQASDVRVHPIGHWGTTADQNFIYAHLSRAINKHDLSMFYIEDPEYDGQVMVSNSYLDRSYSKIYPNITQDETGLKQLCKTLSFPGGIAPHVASKAPGSIHEGGELGYVLSHTVGAALDNPDVIAATVTGDSGVETDPLSAGWFSDVFTNPINNDTVLPVLYLNGGKIHSPTILACESDESLCLCSEGLDWDPVFVEVTDYATTHKAMAQKLDEAIRKIKAVQAKARAGKAEEAVMPKRPILVARLPKDWTGPKVWNGKPIEGGFRAHRVSIPANSHDMAVVGSLVEWLESYRSGELLDTNGTSKAELCEISLKGGRRISTNLVTNGGINPRPLNTTGWEKFALDNSGRGSVIVRNIVELGKYAAESAKVDPDNFRILDPDETKSNRTDEVFKATNRQWLEPIDRAHDERMSLAGRVIDSQLSEHQAEGLSEGYVLTGRHDFLISYESFLCVVDFMAVRHLEWLYKCRTHAPWHKSYPSLNPVATLTVFQRDRNDYTRQGPDMLTHLAEKKPEFIREYPPANANNLLAAISEVSSPKDKTNLTVSPRHLRPQFYSAAEVGGLVCGGYKAIDQVSIDKGSEPDVVIAAAAIGPNLEALAAVTILNKQFPEPKIRFINVVDILEPRHPKANLHGLTDEQFDALFTKDKPVISCFHSYKDMVCDISFDRRNRNLHIHGCREDDDITTPFDVRVLSEVDRFHVARDAVLAVYGDKAQDSAKRMDDTLAFHYNYIREDGEDISEVRNWKWEAPK